MARSGPSSHRRHSRQNTPSRSQCSDSNPPTTFSNVPLPHRPIPGLNILASDGLLPLPTAVQHFDLTATSSQGAQRDGHTQVEVPQPLITIPTHIIQASHKKLFGNKVVLVFESEYDSRRTLSWLAAFNQESPIALTLSDVLNNSLFVVQFDAALGLEARDLLVQRSPLKALDCFAAVNPYGPDFDPIKLPDFKHLATIHIARGSPLIFEYLSFVVSPIGKLIRSNIAPGSESHRITAVVETSLKTFPPLVRIQIPPSGIVSIPFDFSGRHERCLNCLSYSHSKAHCTSTRGPSILGIPPPPPPFFGASRPPSSHTPSIPSSSITHSIQELQAKAAKDKLEIQYWQSVALSLQKNLSPAVKLQTILTILLNANGSPQKPFPAPLSLS